MAALAVKRGRKRGTEEEREGGKVGERGAEHEIFRPISPGSCCSSVSGAFLFLTF